MTTVFNPGATSPVFVGLAAPQRVDIDTGGTDLIDITAGSTGPRGPIGPPGPPGTLNVIELTEQQWAELVDPEPNVIYVIT
jgi:hypothetical protein